MQPSWRSLQIHLDSKHNQRNNVGGWLDLKAQVHKYMRLPWNAGNNWNRVQGRKTVDGPAAQGPAATAGSHESIVSPSFFRLPLFCPARKHFKRTRLDNMLQARLISIPRRKFNFGWVGKRLKTRLNSAVKSCHWQFETTTFFSRTKQKWIWLGVKLLQHLVARYKQGQQQQGKKNRRKATSGL